MHLCSKIQIQQLINLIADGISPEKLPVHGLLWSSLRGLVDYEVFADDWPHFSALVLRPNPQWKPKCKSAFYTYATDYDKLHGLLCNRDVVPWKLQKIIFTACNSRTMSILQKIATQYNVHITPSAPCDVFSFSGYAPSTDHRSLLPTGFYLDHVRCSEAAFINKFWTHSDDKQSELMIQLIAEHMPTACIRNENGDLVSWSMCQFDGQLGIGYTLEQYRRKRFNNLISKELMWRCRSLDFPIFTYIVKSNQASQAHIRKGFDVDHFSDAYTWCTAAPAGDNSKL